MRLNVRFATAEDGESLVAVSGYLLKRLPDHDHQVSHGPCYCEVCREPTEAGPYGR